MQRKRGGLGGSFYGLILLLGLLGYSGLGHGKDAEGVAQSALHMLDYISVDYPEFVRNGRVSNEQEYQEQLGLAR